MPFHGKDPVEVLKHIQKDLQNSLHLKSIEFSEKIDSARDVAFAYLDFLQLPSSQEANAIVRYLVSFLGPMDNYVLLEAASFAAEWDWGNNARNFFTKFVYDTAKGLAHIEVEYKDRPAKPFAEKDTEKQLPAPESKEDFDWDTYNAKLPGNQRKYVMSHLLDLADQYESLAKYSSKCIECGTDNPYVDVEPYHCKLCKDRKAAISGDAAGSSTKPTGHAQNGKAPFNPWHLIKEVEKIIGKEQDEIDVKYDSYKPARFYLAIEGKKDPAAFQKVKELIDSKFGQTPTTDTEYYTWDNWPTRVSGYELRLFTTQPSKFNRFEILATEDLFGHLKKSI